MNEPLNDRLTETQAAEILGVQPRTVRAWRMSRGLPLLKLTGKCVRLRRRDLEAWYDRTRVAFSN